MIEALAEARRRELLTIAMVGYDGARSPASGWPNAWSRRSEHIPRIQEAQATAYHALRELWRACARPGPGPRAGARVRVEGTVQGVGFRPYVYRLAGELGLAGFVFNDARGVVAEVEGAERGGRARSWPGWRPRRRRSRSSRTWPSRSVRLCGDDGVRHPREPAR